MIKIADTKSFYMSLIISLIYVGFGTFSLLGILTISPFYNELFYIGVFICMPVDFIGFAILFTEENSLWLVMIIQIIMFFLFWAYVYGILKNRKKKKKFNFKNLKWYGR